MLSGTNPLIWRRVQVFEQYTFWDLHVPIQDAMGWLDYHLHEFRLLDATEQRVVSIGIPTDDDRRTDRFCLAGTYPCRRSSTGRHAPDPRIESLWNDMESSDGLSARHHARSCVMGHVVRGLQNGPIVMPSSTTFYASVTCALMVTASVTAGGGPGKGVRARFSQAPAVVMNDDPIAYRSRPYTFVLDLVGGEATIVVSLKISAAGEVTEAVVDEVVTARSRPSDFIPGAISNLSESVLQDLRQWRYKEGAERSRVVTYRIEPSDDTCLNRATILRVRNSVATTVWCRPAPDHVSWSSNAEVAYFTEMVHPGSLGPSQGTGNVFLSVRVDGDGRVRSAKVLSGPSDLAELSTKNVRGWRFHGPARTVTVGYRFSVVNGRCSGHYAGLSGAGTLMNVIGCSPPS